MAWTLSIANKVRIWPELYETLNCHHNILNIQDMEKQLHIGAWKQESGLGLVRFNVPLDT